MTIEQAKKFAQKHYDMLQQEDIKKWAATLTEENREKALNQVYGDSPDYWWKTGRRNFTLYGVSYRFHHVEYAENEYCKLFFVRLNPDGSERGMPVPIYLKKEKGKWRVEQASY